MKILFICRSNAERSQTAEALFNALSKKHKALSAGINVDMEGTKGHAPGRIVTELMYSMGYDIINMKRKQLKPKMIKDSDKVVVILSNKEVKQYLPDYVKKSPKTIIWKTYLIPKSVYANFPPHTYNHHTKMVDIVQQKVKKLLKDTD